MTTVFAQTGDAIADYEDSEAQREWAEFAAPVISTITDHFVHAQLIRTAPYALAAEIEGRKACLAGDHELRVIFEGTHWLSPNFGRCERRCCWCGLERVTTIGSKGWDGDAVPSCCDVTQGITASGDPIYFHTANCRAGR